MAARLIIPMVIALVVSASLVDFRINNKSVIVTESVITHNLNNGKTIQVSAETIQGIPCMVITERNVIVGVIPTGISSLGFIGE